MAQATIWIGTSGWVYKHWAQNFYPRGWPKQNEFAYYVRHFPTVEINATFYRLPTRATVRGWRDKAPDGFVFAIKGSRYLTHIKRLKGTAGAVAKYFRRLAHLGDRTGPVLWQLPPNFAKTDENTARVDRFLSRLPTNHRHAIEFRHSSWLTAETFALLRRHRVANVWLSSLRMPADTTITADFVYLRFHGLEGGAYHDYTEPELEPWARQLAAAARRGLPAYVYFNNDLNTRAPLNAATLMRLLGARAVPARAPAGDAIAAIEPPPRGAETWPAWRIGSRQASRAAGPAKRPMRETAGQRARSRGPAPSAGTARPPSRSRRRHPSPAPNRDAR